MTGKTECFAFIQVRNGSSRLPNKMSIPLVNGLTIPQLIVRRLKAELQGVTPVILTSSSPIDDSLEELAARESVKCFRGNEEDVLDRFITAADHFGAQHILRICADNPFLSTFHLKELISTFNGDTMDYLSYSFPDGTPIMKSHIGLFAEIMTDDLLKSIAQKTVDPLYREHVTNYIYSHREEFDAQFLPVPKTVAERRDIRLTLDTAADMETINSLLKLVSPSVEIKQLVSAIDARPEILDSMKKEIASNSK